MTGRPAPPAFVIEQFDPQKHDRESFSSGIPTVDNYLKLTANKLVRAGNVRLSIATAPGGEIAGFYAVNAHSVELGDLPRRFARAAASHGRIPAAFLSMMGRDERFRGRGLGDLLMADALSRIAQAAARIGIAVILLDVLDCGDPERVRRRHAFYQRFGFQPLSAQPDRLYLPLATYLSAL